MFLCRSGKNNEEISVALLPLNMLQRAIVFLQYMHTENVKYREKSLQFFSWTSQCEG